MQIGGDLHELFKALPLILFPTSGQTTVYKSSWVLSVIVLLRGYLLLTSLVKLPFSQAQGALI